MKCHQSEGFIPWAFLVDIHTKCHGHTSSIVVGQLNDQLTDHHCCPYTQYGKKGETEGLLMTLETVFSKCC